jgi:hypothetical protein
MGATTTIGTGPGSAYNIKPLVFNGTVKAGNLGPMAVQDNLSGESKLLSLSKATVTLTEADHAGKILVLARAAGVIVTLPASSGKGAKYTFMVRDTVTSNNYIIKVANTSESFVGRALTCADGGNTVNGWEVTSGDDTITLNGGTKGGYGGDTIEVLDIGANLFVVNAFLNQTATEATPFSATV